MIKFIKRQWLRLKQSWLAFKREWRFNTPYYGQPIMRIDGHVFTLKHKHYNPTTGDVRYLDTDKPKDGYMVEDLNWYHDNLD